MPHLKDDLDFLLLDPTAMSVYAGYVSSLLYSSVLQGPPNAHRFLQINSRISAARSDDLGNINKRIITYIHGIRPYSQHPNGLPVSLIKHERGFYHHITGRLLTPVSLLGEFDEDEVQCVFNRRVLTNDVLVIGDHRFCSDVRNGERAITADDFPAFLYDTNQTNVDDPTVGLFRGPLIVKVSTISHIMHRDANA